MLPNAEDNDLISRRPFATVLLWASLLAAVIGCTGWPLAHTSVAPAGQRMAEWAATAPGPLVPPDHLPPPPRELKSSLVAGEAGTANAHVIVRGQSSAEYFRLHREAAGSNHHLRERMPVSQAPVDPLAANPAPAFPAAPVSAVEPAHASPEIQRLPPTEQPPSGMPAEESAPGYTPLAPAAPPPPTPPNPILPLTDPPASPFASPFPSSDPILSTPLDVIVEETQTGRFMFGAGINSDAGVTGQIVIDERNFDITRVPGSFRDFVDGTAFRGAGQGFRLEAMPGSKVQRYLVSFTEPYFLDTPVSMNLNGFLFDRRYYDWDEQRLGGRVGLGYRLTHDLSISGTVRAENVKIRDVRVPIPALTDVLGNNALYSGRGTLTHDTRDVPFFPTEGHLIELSFEQVFGDFLYPRGELDYRRYFLIRERPDGSGRHTLGNSFQLGISGSDTPVFENYFAGGYSTLRGFAFRGASPMDTTVQVGGRFRFLGSTEYTFPLTADDMLKGAFFVDYGTVEETTRISSRNFRVAPGFGVRISVPALGPAPLAFDFAFPVAKADTDDTQVFSFFFGVGR